MKVIDAQGSVMGRVSTHVAKLLIDGEEVHVINAEKAIITGRRKQILDRYEQRRDRGKTRKGPFFPRTPDQIVKRSIRGMIPYQTPSGREAYKNLRVHIGTPKDIDVGSAETLDDAKQSRAPSYMEVGELSKILGAKF